MHLAQNKRNFKSHKVENLRQQNRLPDLLRNNLKYCDW